MLFIDQTEKTKLSNSKEPMSLLGVFEKTIGNRGWLFNFQQRCTNYQAFRKTFSGIDVSGSKILDLGCGTSGCVHFIWRGKQFSYLGIDLCSTYLRWGKNHFRSANQVCADVQFLPLRKLDCDFVCIFSLLHHLPDEVIRNLSRELEQLPKKTRIFIADPLFPDESKLTLSDRLSQWLLNHDRGHFIRESEAYAKLFSPSFEVTKRFKFKCCMHHFCAFELKRA
jgi:SAM-dependent methyltransferase